LTELPLNQILHGDCLDYLTDFPAESIDLIVTDPPFKISQKYGGGVDADNLIAVSSILQTLPEISRILKNGKFAVIFYDNRILPFVFHATKGTELIYRKSIFLYRRWGNANRWMGWMQCTDPILFFVKGHEKPFNVEIKGKVRHDCYIKRGPEREDTGHPAQKPIEVIKDIIFWCSNKGDIVLDPYCGSGTTCLASKLLGRKFIGIDTKKEYVELSITRLENSNTLSDLLPITPLVSCFTNKSSIEENE